MSNENNFTFTGQGSIDAETLQRLAEQAAASAPSPQAAPAPASEEAKTATVTVVRSGKNGSETMNVEVGSSIADCLSALNWDYEGHSFKLVTPGGGVINTSDARCKFGEGASTLFVTAKVVGG